MNMNFKKGDKVRVVRVIFGEHTIYDKYIGKVFKINNVLSNICYLDTPENRVAEWVFEELELVEPAQVVTTKNKDWLDDIRDTVSKEQTKQENETEETNLQRMMQEDQILPIPTKQPKRKF